MNAVPTQTAGFATGTKVAAAPPTRSELVAQQLRALIVAGDLSPGTKLRQIDVAARFGVSTTPVREAFAALAREGLVRADAHRGAVVFSPSLKDIRENYEMRIALERLATELAAPAIDARTCEALAALLEEMGGAISDRVVYHDLNRRFHILIYAAADRPNLVELIGQLRAAAAAYLMVVPGQSIRDVNHEHADILDALRAGDPARAGDAMARHLQRSFDDILLALSRVEPAADVSHGRQISDAAGRRAHSVGESSL